MTRISSIVMPLIVGGFLTTAMAAFGQQCDIVFQGTPVVSPDPVTAGRDITFSYVIHNNGPGNAGTSLTSVIIGNAGGEIAARNFPAPAVNAGANSSTQYCTLTIPAATPIGIYTAYAYLDIGSELDQSDTSNDGSTVSFTVFVKDYITLTNRGIYHQDFSIAQPGATALYDGSQLFSTSLSNVTAVVGDPERNLRLTQADVPGVRAAFAAPLLNPTNFITAFSAKWNMTVDGNFPDAGDGFSFNFGPMAIDSSLISTNWPQESGYTNGLAFSVQTYTGNAPGFYLRLNGATIASSNFNPTTEWGNYGSVRHFFEVDWALRSGMTVSMDGQTIFTNVPTTGFVPQFGNRFVWAARCGALTEDLRLDNVLLVAGANLKELAVGPPYFNNAGGGLPQNAFDGNDLTPYFAETNAGYVGGTLAVTSTVCAYAITTSSNPDRTTDPGQWMLQGSADGGVTWSGANPITSDSFVVPSETFAWVTTNTTSYPAWRLNFLTNGGSGQTLLAGLRLYQAVPGVAYVNPVIFGGSGLNWSSNQSGAYTTPMITNNVLRLTDGASGEARSVFYQQPQYVGAFKASFTYQDVGGGGADGMAFVLQNDPRGLSALGGAGGGLGYGTANPITPSAALELNIYNGNSEIVGYTFLTNGLTGNGGANGNYHAPGAISLASGHAVSVAMNYAGGQLALTFTDLVTSVTFTTNLTIGNLTNIVGGETAYIGFTGADGDTSSSQTIANFSFVSLPTASINITNSALLISWPAAIGGFELQQKISTLQATNWTDLTNQPAVVNGRNQINLPLPATNQFYRLKL